MFEKLNKDELRKVLMTLDSAALSIMNAHYGDTRRSMLNEFWLVYRDANREYCSR